MDRFLFILGLVLLAPHLVPPSRRIFEAHTYYPIGMLWVGACVANYLW